MKNHFTFIKSPELTALHHALELMPGLQQVDLILRNDTQKRVNVFRLKEKDNQIVELHIDDLIINETYLFSLRQKNASWYQKSDLPYFESNTEKRNHNDLFTELNTNVLIVTISSIASLPELIYVFSFRKNASELGPVSANSVLDTSQKQLLSRILYNSLKAMLSSIVENRKVMLEYNDMLGNIIKSKEKEIEEIKKIQESSESYLDSILNNYVNELKLPNENIIIVEELKQKLYPYLSDKEYLKSQISKAINFARTFNFLKKTTVLELKPEYFSELKDLEAIKDQGINENTHRDVYSTHTKTYRFLQALEEAAIRLLEKGERLTSLKVGEELDKPVTAAAISDKLKNHAYKIHLLLNQFPDKWPVVRSQFKPVINIQEKQAKEKFAS